MELIKILKPDFIFKNDSGLLVQLVHDGWKQVNTIFSNKDSVRGGHYHKYNEEAFYIITGAFRITVWNDDEKQTYEFHAGDMFQINRNVFHTFEYLEDTWLVSMYSNGVEMDGDVKDIWTE